MKIKFDLAGGQQKADGNRQVIDRTFFFEIGRRQIDRDPAALVRRFEFTVADGGADPVTRFLDGRVRQSDNIELVQPGGNRIDFDLDQFALEPDSSGGEYFGRHKSEPLICTEYPDYT